MDLENPRRRNKEQVNYITLKKRFRNATLQCKTYPSADDRCDYLLVIGKLKVTLQKLKKSRVTSKLQDNRFLNDQNRKEKYTVQKADTMDKIRMKIQSGGY